MKLLFYRMEVLCLSCIFLIAVNGCSSIRSEENPSVSGKVSLKEGVWSFDIENETATVTYYAGKTDAVVIVPSVLGGRPVTAVASQTFGHHGEILEVYVPSSVVSVSDWAFYDLNTAALISFANPLVRIADGAFQSSANAALYLPSDTTQKAAGGKQVVSDGAALVTVTLINSRKAAVAGGSYLAVNGKPSVQDITAVAKSYDGSVAVREAEVTFTGSDYAVRKTTFTIAASLAGKVSQAELNRTFRSLTAVQAGELNAAIASDPAYADVASLIHFEAGYYLNGNKIQLSDETYAYDVQTGLPVGKDSDGLFPSALPSGSTAYKYVAAKDTDDDGVYDILYYSSDTLSYAYDTVTIKSSNKNLNGLSARTVLNPVYKSFANGVIEAHGTNIREKNITAATASSGKKTDYTVNEERSLLWADGYGTITAGSVDGVSTSTSNWAKMSYEAGLDAYNVEITMEWGLNALLYATDGGQITVGTARGNRSTFKASGDGANGIIAGGTGKNAPGGKYSTSAVSVTNADFTLTGWNNHVADVVYGGYASLTDVTGVTGIRGSYAVGQASALANDFGNGVVDADNFNTTVYGNRSAGAYVIGGGVITARDSSFTSYADSGLVIASGGTYQIADSAATGVIALRNRGGITADSTSTFANTSFTADRTLMQPYVTGERAANARAAWKKASGSDELIHYLASDPSTTFGTLCSRYSVSGSAKQELYDALGAAAGTVYTDKTPFRLSVLDNSYYNYSAGAYTGSTDYSDVPYLSEGSAFGGLVSSVFEFESAGVTLNLNNCTYLNTNSGDYQYLAASEAGSAPVLNFRGGSPSGIIYNEGNVFRSVEGRPDNRSSKLTAHFTDCTFAGSFADGSNGLWNVPDSVYTDATGSRTSRNGNYYNAAANWGITAVFDSGASWTVTHDSYLGSLTIASGASVKALAGYTLVMTVNGAAVPVVPGTYSGQIVVTVEKE